MSLDFSHTAEDLDYAADLAPEPEPGEYDPALDGLSAARPDRMTVEQAAAKFMRPFQRVTVDLTVNLPPTPLLTDWIYGGGCLTVLQSEPGVGKSWVALWLCLGIIDAGYDAIYIDEEGGLELVHERLALLGADPVAVAGHFHYFAFENRTWGEEDMLALTAMLGGVEQPRLAVLDSLPDFLAVAGQDEDRAKDVTSFIKKVCGAFREVGCSQLLLDHLTKPNTDGKKHRSRYSRGSGSKLGKADATLLLEAEEEFDTHTSGKLKVWKTKDRRGRLPLPNLTKPGRPLLVTVGGGLVRFVEAEEEGVGVERKPTVLMERISMALEGRLDEVTQNGLLSIVNGNTTYKKKALEHLVADGYVSREKQGQAYLIASVKPYRNPEEASVENNERWQP